MKEKVQLEATANKNWLSAIFKRKKAKNLPASILKKVCILLLFACSSMPIQAQKAEICVPLTITATNITATSAELTWQISEGFSNMNIELLATSEPPQQRVTHSSETNSITLDNLEPDEEYQYFKQIVCSAGNSTWKFGGRFITLEVPEETTIPDADFEDYLETHNAAGTEVDFGDKDSMGNGMPKDNKVFTASIENVTSLDVRGQGISDLTGIADFTALISLTCSENKFPSLDVSKNTALTLLICDDNNELTKINVANGNNTNLDTFRFDAQILARGGPGLTCVQVDNTDALNESWPQSNAYSEDCYDPATTEIPDADFEDYLETHNAAGTEVDFGDANSMGNGMPKDNKVFTASIENVTSLDVRGQGISDLTGIADFTALTSLNCSSNSLSNLDLRTNTSLKEVRSHVNKLTSLDVSENTALTLLDVSNNQLIRLDISKNTALTSLDASGNPLTELNAKNGNNENFTWFNVVSNPNLTCILVDNAQDSPEGWSKDETASYNEDTCEKKPFITVWETTAANESITIPTYESSGYNYTVDWGDESEQETYEKSATHQYATAGNYTVSITGIFPAIYFNGDGNEQIKDIKQWGDIAWESFNEAFKGCTNLNSTATDVPDLSNVTDMSSMFENATSFNQDISSWDVSAVTNMGYMFYAATAFNKPLNWKEKTGNVTNMSSMFAGSEGQREGKREGQREGTGLTVFNQDISGWDVGKVTDMRGMFQLNAAFNQDLSSWNVSSVTDMSSMFAATTAFNEPLNWATKTGNVTNMSGMFAGSEGKGKGQREGTGLTVFNQDISGWDVSKVTKMQSMFRFNRAFNQNISGWNVSSVSDMRSMFLNAIAFNQDISGWNIIEVYDMDNMLDNSGFSQENYDKLLTAWSTKEVKTGVELGAEGIGYCTGKAGRTKLTEEKRWTIIDAGAACPFITVWETTADKESITIPTNRSYDYYNYTVDWGDGSAPTTEAGNATHTYESAGDYTVSITGIFPAIYFDGDRNEQIKDIKQWGDIAWESFVRAFKGCTNLNSTATDVPDLSNVTDMSDMFYEATSFNQDISKWDVTAVTDMSYMFYNATAFNQDISDWNVSAVTTMSNMFFGATAFNKPLAWGTKTDKVANMSSMFDGATAFNQNISDWNVSAVTSMQGMFFGATAFNKPLAWAVSAVKDMSYMFKNATAFNQDISDWDAGAVTNMSSMFYNATTFNKPLAWGTKTDKVANMSSMFFSATAFNQDISDWDVGAVTNMSSMFYNATTFNKPLAWGAKTDKVANMYEMFFLATAFNQDISDWDVSAVTDMSSMFSFATAFNKPLAWGTKTDKVAKMPTMFFGATAFNQDISDWDVGAVTNMSSMFQNATAFNQDISSWDVSKVITMANMLDKSALSMENYDKLLSAWSTQEVLTKVSLGAAGLRYCDGAAGRTTLKGKNWTITGDTRDCGPLLGSTSPADNATGVALDANIVFTFNKNILLGDGLILLSKSEDLLNTTFSRETAITAFLGFGATVAGMKLTINPTANLEPSTAYTIQILNDAVKDETTGDFYGGTTLNFTTTNKTNPVITFNDFSKIYGSEIVTLTATSKSTGTVTYTIVGEANGASISGDKLTLGNVGSIKVKVTIAADANYFEASKEITVTSTKAAITITADAKTKNLGAADPAFTYKITTGSLKTGDVLTGSLSRVSGEDVGDYAITSTLANSNYTITFVSKNLSIAKKATVMTNDATSITNTSAVLGGTVTDDGGSFIKTRGVAYSETSINPNPEIDGIGVTVRARGAGTGVFSLRRSDLTEGVNYSFRAYAISDAGTSYGAVKTFGGTVLGLDNFALNNAIGIYPNPIKNVLYIKTSTVAIEKVTLFDVLGKAIKNIALENETIDFSRINTGVYLLKIITDKGTLIKRIMKE